MISGGNATVYVADMDAAVEFYSRKLGLKLANRFGNHWATVEAGPSYWTTEEVMAGLVLGLHPASPKYPAPGTPGAVMFGVETYSPIEDVVAQLAGRGVRMIGDIIRFEAGNTIGFQDPDGTPTYLHHFPPEMVPDTDLGAENEPSSDDTASLLSGGHALVYVSNMDAAVRFYSEVLGLRLTNRYGDKFATVEAGSTLVIGLHPQSPKAPAPGTPGSVMLGLSIDEPLDRVVSTLSSRGVRLTGEIVRSGQDKFVPIEDQDGNQIYLWEAVPKPAPKKELASANAARQ